MSLNGENKVNKLQFARLLGRVIKAAHSSKNRSHEAWDGGAEHGCS